MAVTQIDIDDDALDRAMALSRARTKKDAVNLALRYYAERQERAARVGRHFEPNLYRGVTGSMTG